MCEHEWQGKFDGVCPYGSVMLGDVTWPDEAKARSLNADLAGEMANSHFWIVVSVAYSYVPIVIVLVALLRLGVRRGTQELWLVMLLVVTWVVNELILKGLIRQARPEISCAETCGMPSSHAAFALNVWTFFLVDLLWRLDSTAMRSACHSASELWNVTPWDVLAWDEALLWGLVWSLVLLPVPASRVFLGDHSLQQVFVGGCVGALMTACAWMVGRGLQKRFNHRLGEDLLAYQGQSLLCHNMALPYSEILRRCRNQAARSFVDSQTELTWYIDQIARCLRDEPSNTPRRLRLEAVKSNLESFVNRRTVHDRTQELLRTPSTPLLNAAEVPAQLANNDLQGLDPTGTSASSAPRQAALAEALGDPGSAESLHSTMPLEIAAGQADSALPAEGPVTSTNSSLTPRPAERTSEQAAGSVPSSPTEEASENLGPESFMSVASQAAVAESAEASEDKDKPADTEGD